MLACNLLYPAAPDAYLRVQCAGGTFREGRIGHLNGDGVPAEALRTLRAVDWVTFGGVLIRREVLRACGPFDDRYRWAYVMDVDYCFEARLRGFSCSRYRWHCNTKQVERRAGSGRQTPSCAKTFHATSNCFTKNGALSVRRCRQSANQRRSPRIDKQVKGDISGRTEQKHDSGLVPPTIRRLLDN